MTFSRDSRFHFHCRQISRLRFFTPLFVIFSQPMGLYLPPITEARFQFSLLHYFIRRRRHIFRRMIDSRRQSAIDIAAAITSQISASPVFAASYFLLLASIRQIASSLPQTLAFVFLNIISFRKIREGCMMPLLRQRISLFEAVISRH